MRSASRGITETPFSAGSAARALAALFAAGALSGACVLALPHPAAFDDLMLWTNVALPAVTALAIWLLGPRLPMWATFAAAALGVVVITRAVLLSNIPDSVFNLWYVWVGLFGFLFFGRRGGLVLFALMAIGLGFAQITIPGGNVSIWAMTLATTAVGGALVDFLLGRIRRRAADADSRARSLELVSSVAHELARQSSASEAALVVCRAARELGGAMRVSLWEPAASGRALTRVAATAPDQTVREVAFVTPNSPSVECFTSGRRVFRELADVAPGAPQRSSLYEPIVLDGIPVGVLAICWPTRIEEPDEEALRLFSLLAVEAATALARVRTLARLERVARTDELTGLHNRRAWDELVATELSRARREGGRLAVALLDLDHFKRFNDEHGHQAGDRLLKEAAAAWVRVIRASDVIARYGGEEFALALPGVGQAEAEATIARIRDRIPRGQQLSAGLVFWDGTETETDLVARADAALYRAKASGRDRVVRA